MMQRRVIVVGAGVAGLVAALLLAHRGFEVLLIEKGARPGGKMRRVDVAGAALDTGPTVFTMRWVFEEIFAEAGIALADEVSFSPLGVLARHAWPDGSRLDLFADPQRTAAAIGDFAGAREAEGYLDFCRRSRQVYSTLERSFIRAERPTPFSLAFDAGLSGLADLVRISPFTTLWRALSDHFRDPRLRQLFARYATYCGSSPFLAPATLMLVAHVEQDGVWTIDGGMFRLAEALEQLAIRHGAGVRYGAEVARIETAFGRVTGVVLADGERLPADAIVFNGDAAALADGMLGEAVAGAVPSVPRRSRSLSAMTWTLVAPTSGFPLLRHNVFFSGDYAAEFDDIFVAGRVPLRPTIYVCAQDRGDAETDRDSAPERLLCLINAPANGDRWHMSQEEITRCEGRTFGHLRRLGLSVERQPEATILTTPTQFAAAYPATGGALYGQASHGWQASFSRPAAATEIPGLYLAGGSTHPGAGVPMAALSGRMAAHRLAADLTSARR